MTINLNELVRGGTFCLSKAGLAIGSNAAKAKILAPNGAGVDFAINGVLYHKADTDDAVVFSDTTALGLLSQCLYLVCLDTSGTVSVVNGTAKTTAAIDAGGVLDWPTPVVNKCPIGAIKVQTLTSGTFTPGTTALTPAATLGVTYYDLFAVPVSPLTA